MYKTVRASCNPSYDEVQMRYLSANHLQLSQQFLASEFLQYRNDIRASLRRRLLDLDDGPRPSLVGHHHALQHESALAILSHLFVPWQCLEGHVQELMAHNAEFLNKPNSIKGIWE